MVRPRAIKPLSDRGDGYLRQAREREDLRSGFVPLVAILQSTSPILGLLQSAIWANVVGICLLEVVVWVFRSRLSNKRSQWKPHLSFSFYFLPSILSLCLCLTFGAYECHSDGANDYDDY